MHSIFDLQAPNFLFLLNSLVEPEDTRSLGNLNGKTLFVDLGTADREVLTGLGCFKFLDLGVLKRLWEHRERILFASGVADNLN